MLDNLLEIEVAYNLMKGESGPAAGGKDPIDVHYGKLNTKMEVRIRSDQIRAFSYYP